MIGEVECARRSQIQIKMKFLRCVFLKGRFVDAKRSRSKNKSNGKAITFNSRGGSKVAVIEQCR